MTVSEPCQPEITGKKQTFKDSLSEINSLLDPDEQLTEQSLSKIRSENVPQSGSPRQRAAITAVLGEDAGAACDWEALCRLERHRSEVKDLVISRKDERILELEREVDPRHKHWIANVKGTLIICLVSLVLITWGLLRPALTLATIEASDGLIHKIALLYEENLRLKRVIDSMKPVIKELKGEADETERRLGKDKE
jgi:hypothetical protein